MLIRSALLLWAMIQIFVPASQTQPQVTPTEDPPLCLYVDIEECKETFIKTQCIDLCTPKTDPQICQHIKTDRCQEAYVKAECPWKCRRPAIGLDLVDGWSAWSLWSNCSSSCGGGKRNRRRECTKSTPANGGKDCSGKIMLEEDCNSQSCTTNGAVCPSPWFTLGGQCFLVVVEHLSWASARAYCGAQAPGADLAQPNDLKALDDYMLNNGYGRNTAYWLGGSDLGTEGDWHWVNDGGPITTGWAQGEPNSYGGDQDCLAMNPGLGANCLGDLGFGDAWPFICGRL